MKKVWVLFFILFAMTSVCSASFPFDRPCRMENIMGEIVRIDPGRSYVTIQGSKPRITKTFFAHSRTLQGFNEGDSVRIYYKCDSKLLWSIKRMTPTDNLPEEFNRGFIFKK